MKRQSLTIGYLLTKTTFTSLLDFKPGLKQGSRNMRAHIFRAGTNSRW
jgi:hypothetical protein